MRTLASIDDGEFIHVGVAMRHPKDRQFSKKMGRSIAGGRARFALAQSLGLTERTGSHSRYELINTVPAEEFVPLARSFGLNISAESETDQEKSE